ncbi:trypsin-like serine peptidase [Bacillus thuringiensis]|uniref:trypsin-like serine peptidase n=1 Tax=Bacillus thuringiensis TaxID=1428 RepID=UPI001C54C1A1|nr:serine protease [Bacillus thuringiensis]MED3057741.1 serine protease [Bacillus thuringiensis]
MNQDENSQIVNKVDGESTDVYVSEGSIGGQALGQTSYFADTKNVEDLSDLPTIEQLEGMQSGNSTSSQVRNSGLSREEIDSLPTIEQLEGLVPETICGSDERSQILNTKIYPWRAICQLIITRADGARARATGWLNGKGTVITAGHCVYSTDLNKWNTSITVILGRNGTEEPYGEITSTNLSSVKGWTEKHDPNYDYGAIILPNHIGDTTGYFGFAIYQDSQLRNVKANLSGYPGDKPNTQWFMYDTITNVNERKIYYNIDTMGGHSGSPVWIDAPNGQHYAVGIHAYGGCPNSATRINQDVYNNLLNWKQRGDQ